MTRVAAPDTCGPAATTRSQVAAAVAARPGATRQEICQHTGLSWGAVACHIDAMVGSGQISETRWGRRRIFFVGMPADVALLVRLVREDPLACKVLQAFGQGPCGVSDAAMLAGTTPKRVRRHIRVLQQTGVLRTTQWRGWYELSHLPLALARSQRTHDAAMQPAAAPPTAR